MPKKRFKLIAEVYLILVRRNQILLLKRQNTGYEDGRYSFIAGHVEEKEPLTKAIMREVKEEAGIKIKKRDLSLVHIMHRNNHDSSDERIGFFFKATKWQGNITNMERNKCAELKWFSLKRLPQNIIPYIKKAISNYEQRILYSEDGFEDETTN